MSRRAYLGTVIVGASAANEVVAAGYLGVRPLPRPEWVDARYVRDPLLSLSADLVAVGPTVTWVGSADEELAALGVAADQRGDARAWIDDLERCAGILHPNVCRTPDVVAEFSDRFVSEGLAVLGVALPADQVDTFLVEHEAYGQQDGIVILLGEARPLAPGYRPLGYEPVSVDYGGLRCSWTCNGLQAAVAEATGIVPNEWGFIDTEEEAETVMTFLADPAVGLEPGMWRAWLVARYDAVA